MIGPLAYISGKNRLASIIIPLFPPHTTYVEPFAGGAQVFFHKDPSHVEVLNDLSFDVVNFFRVCQWHYEELARQLRFHPISRKWHEFYVGTNPESMTDIQRAARFLYLQKCSFGGLVVNQRFHYGVTSRPNYNPRRIPEIIEQAHARLRGVQVESLPYEDILRKYDRSTTLFYLDPPYFGRMFYKFNFEEDDFVKLAERLMTITGKFILSINDTPEVRRIFAAFRVQTATLAYTAKQNAGKRFTELLIMNFVPAPPQGKAKGAAQHSSQAENKR